MNVINYPERGEWNTILARPVQNLEDIEGKVAPILADVRQNGDDAIRRLSLKFDHIAIDSFLFSEVAFEQAESKLDETLKSAIHQAYSNIYNFHSRQLQPIEKVETMAGVTCWRKS